jgi:hypothetical protein
MLILLRGVCNTQYDWTAGCMLGEILGLYVGKGLEGGEWSRVGSGGCGCQQQSLAESQATSAPTRFSLC